VPSEATKSDRLAVSVEQVARRSNQIETLTRPGIPIRYLVVVGRPPAPWQRTVCTGLADDGDGRRTRVPDRAPAANRRRNTGMRHHVLHILERSGGARGHDGGSSEELAESSLDRWVILLPHRTHAPSSN